jgi:hypothetical protein
MSPRKCIFVISLLCLTGLPVWAQDASATLASLEQTARASVSDISHLRVEKWKADGSARKSAQNDADAVQRNMSSALPELIAKVRANPQDLNANFKLYRNLDVLYEVFSRLAETAGAFGSRDDFQTLAKDLDGLDAARKALADRMDALSASTQAELTQYRSQLQAAQAAQTSAPPKKIVIDDSVPDPKPAKKKKPVKPATTPPADASSSGAAATTPK